LEKFSFDVDKFKGKTVKELPQGARKVLDILIAIIGKPKVILLDEPTSGISTDEKNIVMNNILRAIKEFNISVLFIEHDMEIVEKFSERVIAFYNGEIIADDKPSKVFDQNNVKKFIIGGL
jgi:branched-chain amino acid transport system ATP-binding protein